MNASYSFSKVTILSIFFVFFFIHTDSFASNFNKPIVQKEYVFVISGKVLLKSNEKSLDEVNLVLLKDGVTIQSQKTGRNGKYKFKIPISTATENNEYIILISKPGFMTKKLSVNTYISQQEFSENKITEFTCEMPIDMIEFAENEIVLVNPSGKMKWDNDFKLFTFDQEYAKTAKKEEELLLESPKKYSEYIESKKQAKANNATTKVKEKVGSETDKMNAAKTAKEKSVKENMDSKNNRMTTVDEAVGNDVQLKKIDRDSISTEKGAMIDKEIVVKINTREEIKKEENLQISKEKETEKEVKTNKDAKYIGNNRFKIINEAVGEEELKKKELKSKNSKHK